MEFKNQKLLPNTLPIDLKKKEQPDTKNFEISGGIEGLIPMSAASSLVRDFYAEGSKVIQKLKTVMVICTSRLDHAGH